MSSHRLTWLDVFTATPLAGNGLAVVHDADGVSDEQMLRFARETRLSETTFVQTASAAGADYRNRIWMPTNELPFAGHPSLGSAVAVARARGQREARYVQQTIVGLQPVEVELLGDHAARATMLQEPSVFGREIDTGDVMGALGLNADDAHPALPPQVVSTGVPQIIAPLRAGAVGRATPDRVRAVALLRVHGAVVLYAVEVDADGPLPARGFFDGLAALEEDPATGSAAGSLCAYLHARTGREDIAIDQGVAMGRPSRLNACIDGDRVRVGGEVVVLFDGTIQL